MKRHTSYDDVNKDYYLSSDDIDANNEKRDQDIDCTADVLDDIVHNASTDITALSYRSQSPSLSTLMEYAKEMSEANAGSK